MKPFIPAIIRTTLSCILVPQKVTIEEGLVAMIGIHAIFLSAASRLSAMARFRVWPLGNSYKGAS